MDIQLVLLGTIPMKLTVLKIQLSILLTRLSLWSG